MKQRLLVAAVGVPLLILVLVFLPPVATGVLVCAIAAAAAYELLHTACKAPCVPVYVLTALMAVPMGVWTLAMAASLMPASRRRALTLAVLAREPMTPI